MIDNSIIEGAFFMGYEPSSDNLTPTALYAEALNYITDLSQF